MSAAIGLLGDVMLGRGVAARLDETAAAELWSPEVRALLGEQDLVVANLECCISARGHPTDRIPGKPFFFRAPPAATASLEAVGVRAVGLANNHALDYEAEALKDTLDLLDAAGISRTGAGRDGGEARRGIDVDAGGERVGIAAVADHPQEFEAGPGRPGVAYADLSSGCPDWLAGEIADLRRHCDRVIAFPHWGPNMTARPSGWQRTVAAELQRAGADLVAGHSAHVFHGVGWGERGPLVFDLGDAVDDYAVDGALRNDLGVAAVWRPDGDPELELVGLWLDYCRTDLARGDDADWIADRLTRACAELGTSVERLAEQRFAVRPD